MERILLAGNDAPTAARRQQRVEELRSQALRNARYAMDVPAKKGKTNPLSNNTTLMQNGFGSV